MKNIALITMAAMGLFLTLAIANVSAQAPTGAEVNIPFDFVAGTANLKAGTYTVTRNSGNALKIRSTDGKKTVLIHAPLTIGARDFKAGERLVFNRYGNQFFLSQVWLSVEQGRQMFPSKAESTAGRELARRNEKPARVEIALR